MDKSVTGPGDWPLRPWLLAILLGVAGFSVYAISGSQGPTSREAWRAALTALVFFGSLAFAFTLDRDRWKAPLAFAALVGAVMAGLAWRAVAGGDAYADPQYGFMAGVIATGLALPLFQADFHRSRWQTDYRAVHGAVWSDAICVGGSLAFVGASWLMLFLLGELFHLLKIDLIKRFIDNPWFGWSWSGAAFGAALGVLRNEAAIIGTLRRVVMTVLSLLAVPLAAGLAIFLAAMVVSGPKVLWEATRSATPVLLFCAAGAWVLANAILRDEDAAMSSNRALRIAGLTLVISLLPLEIFAAVSMGTRVAQYGLSPERLWGLVAIAVAVAYGFAWLVAVARGGRDGTWRDRVRRANLHVALVVCGVALFLALPILDFGAISARQQLARLDRGEVSAKNFDYEALRWDFGDAGRRALERLRHGGDPLVAKSAREALARKARIYPFGPVENYTLRVQPADPSLERMVRDYLRSNPWVCTKECVALDLGPLGTGKRRVAIVAGGGYTEATLPFDPARPLPVPDTGDQGQLLPGSRVEVREVMQRQIFVDGKPLGPPLADAPTTLEGQPPPR